MNAWLLLILLLGSGLWVACSSEHVSTTVPRAQEVTSEPPSPTLPTSVRKNNRVFDPKPYAYSPLISFDGIRPVYDPQFVNAARAPLMDGELVMGVTLSGQAKAFPITVLRFREMVDDELAGIPILVTW